MKNRIHVAWLAAGLALLLGGCHEDDTTTAPTPNYVQADRMAIPAVNTALIPSSQKEAFNRSTPVNDVANYRSTVVAQITALRTSINQAPNMRGLGPENAGVTPEALGNIVIPDVVTVDFSMPLAFPNGRDLNDDVIDGVLSLVLNRNGIADGVAEDNDPLTAFPYLGLPNALPKPGM